MRFFTYETKENGTHDGFTNSWAFTYIWDIVGLGILRGVLFFYNHFLPSSHSTSAFFSLRLFVLYHRHLHIHVSHARMR